MCKSEILLFCSHEEKHIVYEEKGCKVHDSKNRHRDEHRMQKSLPRFLPSSRPDMTCHQEHDHGGKGTRNGQKHHTRLLEDADCRNGQRAQGADHDEIRHAQEIHEYAFHGGRHSDCEILAIVSGQCHKSSQAPLLPARHIITVADYTTKPSLQQDDNKNLFLFKNIIVNCTIRFRRPLSLLDLPQKGDMLRYVPRKVPCE